MESTDLKALWRESNRRAETSVRLNAMLLEQNLRTTKTALSGLARKVMLELAINVAGIALIGAFAAAHVAQPRFLIPAVALDLYAIALVVLGARQLVEIGKLDFAGSVVAVQAKLQALRILRIRATQWTLLFAPLMWVPLAIVLLQALAGLDLSAAGVAWLVANLLFGLAIVPAGIFVARRFEARFERNATLRYIGDTIAGRNLADALDSLAAIRGFERGAQ